MMITGNFPTGIDEKIPLKEPELWNPEDFDGHTRMAVKRGNTLLENIFSETRTDLPKLIASVRWSRLRMPSKDFANAAGMSYNGYKPMEQDRNPEDIPHHAKVTKLLEFWEEHGISMGVREQLLDLVTCPELLAVDESCTDLLSAIDCIRSQSEQLLGVEQMNAFYQRVGYDCGHETVVRRFRDAHDIKDLYNMIWQRKKMGTVPDCLEVVQLVETMYAGRGKDMQVKRALRHAQGQGIWTGVKKNQYLGRTIEEPLAEFLALLERDLATNAGMTLTAKALREEYGLGPQDADMLIRCELVGTHAIEELAMRLMEKQEGKKFLGEWNSAYEVEQRRKSFGTVTDAAMDERGFTPADLSVLLNVQAPEERGKNVPADRSQRYRGDAEVRGVLYQNRTSGQIAVEAIVRVLARDGDHADELRDAYILERERYFRRTGAWLSGDGLRMSILRELANVKMNELALSFLPTSLHKNRAAVREKNLELQRLERNEGKQHTIPFEKVFSILQERADQRAAEAVARIDELDAMDESLKVFATVREMAVNLIKGKKGADSVSEAMRNIAQNDTQWLRSDLITRMAEGKFVPALPPLRVMAKSTIDVLLTQDVVRDWHAQFPHQLKKGAMDIGTFTQPLPRVLCTLLATKEASAIRFFEDRVPGIVPTQGTKMLRDLEEGKPIEWKYIHKILLATGVLPGQIPYRLAKALHDCGTGGTDAVLAELVPVLQQQNLDIHPVNLPGLTLEELEPHWQRTARRRA